MGRWEEKERWVGGGQGGVAGGGAGAVGVGAG